jgi:hypothetical protein
VTELTARLLSEVKHHQTLWRANFAAAVILFLTALTTSALATVFAATGKHGTVLPWLTATPGVIILANGFFKFGERYTWHFQKSSKLKAVFQQVEYGNAPVKEAVDCWNTVDKEMNEKAPQFGEFSVFPSSKSKE